MVQFLHLLLATVALSAATVASFPFPSPGRSTSKAVYFQTNQSPNSIVAAKVDSNGKIGKTTFHSTGGHGGAELTPTGPHLPDSLGSQHSVVVYGDVSISLIVCKLCKTNLP